MSIILIEMYVECVQDSDPIWLHDSSMGFLECMVLGSEWRYIAFEGALLGVLDFALENVTFTALITYGVHVSLRHVLTHLASRNLSRKALVPETFLL
jgi:hypothetical protein